MIVTIRFIAFALVMGFLLSACQKPATTTNDSLSSASASSETPEKPALNIVGDGRVEDGQIADNNTDNPEWIACPEERAEICTQIYQPVCATIDTGIRCVTAPCPSETTQTFGNACSACADPRAFGYSSGECKPEQKTSEDPINSPDNSRE